MRPMTRVEPERRPGHAATLETRDDVCSRFVELARRMSVPTDDAIAQFITLSIRLWPTNEHGVDASGAVLCEAIGG